MKITNPSFFLKYTKFRPVIHANQIKPCFVLKYIEFRPGMHANQVKPCFKYSEFRPGIHANQVKPLYSKSTRKSKDKIARSKKFVNGINDLVEMV